jgi:hypothetical protein
MATHHEKMKKKPKKTKETKGQHFEDVARKLFKVTKDEITPKDKS